MQRGTFVQLESRIVRGEDDGDEYSLSEAQLLKHTQVLLKEGLVYDCTLYYSEKDWRILISSDRFNAETNGPIGIQQLKLKHTCNLEQLQSTPVASRATLSLTRKGLSVPSASARSSSGHSQFVFRMPLHMYAAIVWCGRKQLQRSPHTPAESLEAAFRNALLYA